jgi:hypothetical protein
MTKFTEHELAEQLERSTDPASPEFDLSFASYLLTLRPNWFSEEETARIMDAIFASTPSTPIN